MTILTSGLGGSGGGSPFLNEFTFEASGNIDKNSAVSIKYPENKVYESTLKNEKELSRVSNSSLYYSFHDEDSTKTSAIGTKGNPILTDSGFLLTCILNEGYGNSSNFINSANIETGDETQASFTQYSYWPGGFTSNRLGFEQLTADDGSGNTLVLVHTFTYNSAEFLGRASLLTINNSTGAMSINPASFEGSNYRYYSKLSDSTFMLTDNSTAVVYSVSANSIPTRVGSLNRPISNIANGFTFLDDNILLGFADSSNTMYKIVWDGTNFSSTAITNGTIVPSTVDHYVRTGGNTFAGIDYSSGNVVYAFGFTLNSDYTVATQDFSTSLVKVLDFYSYNVFGVTNRLTYFKDTNELRLCYRDEGNDIRLDLDTYTLTEERKVVSDHYKTRLLHSPDFTKNCTIRAVGATTSSYMESDNMTFLGFKNYGSFGHGSSYVTTPSYFKAVESGLLGESIKVFTSSDNLLEYSGSVDLDGMYFNLGDYYTYMSTVNMTFS